MEPFAIRRVRLCYVLPSVHLALWLFSLIASRLTRLERVGTTIGPVLAVVDFPVSMIAMVSAWVLPVIVEIIGFGLLGTLWWCYLGRKADLWVVNRRNKATQKPHHLSC